MPQDVELVSMEKVIVPEQMHFAKRAQEKQGGRKVKRSVVDRSMSRDRDDRDTPHANQHGSGSASSGTRPRRPSPRRERTPGMVEVSCSENHDEQPSPCSLRNLFEPRREENNNPTALGSSPSSSSSHYDSSYESDSSGIGWKRGQTMNSWITLTTRPYTKIGWDVNQMVMQHHDPERRIRRTKVNCDYCSHGFTIRSDAVDYWDDWAEKCHICLPAWCCGDRCAYAYSQLPRAPIPEHREDLWWNNGYYSTGFRLEPPGLSLGPVGTKIYRMYELEITMPDMDWYDGFLSRCKC